MDIKLGKNDKYNVLKASADVFSITMFVLQDNDKFVKERLVVKKSKMKTAEERARADKLAKKEVQKILKEKQ